MQPGSDKNKNALAIGLGVGVPLAFFVAGAAIRYRQRRAKQALDRKNQLRRAGLLGRRSGAGIGTSPLLLVPS